MHYLTIDCGTSTSRAFVVGEDGKVCSVAKKAVGVKDTSTSGSKDILRNGVKEIVAEAIGRAGIGNGDVVAILSSGMVTSEIGLCEIPHLSAPCTMEQLAQGITKAPDLGITDASIPTYFVRGIKNKMQKTGMSPAKQVGELDFMRGEETQMAGLLEQGNLDLPAVAVILSSHTKFIPIDKEGTILGSLTTLSGQLFDAVVNHTFLSKSVKQQPGEPERPSGYYNTEVVADADKWIRQVGLVRALMFPRFLNVLLDTDWYERALFLDAMIASEDMLALGQMKMLIDAKPDRYVLIGPEGRCRLYNDILSRQAPNARIISISDPEEIDKLSITGVLSLAKKAGVI